MILVGLGASEVPLSWRPRNPQDDEDGWGDFEAPVDEPAPLPFRALSLRPHRLRFGLASPRASTMDLLTNQLVDLNVTSSSRDPWQERPSWEKGEKTVKAERAKAPKPVQPRPDPNTFSLMPTTLSFKTTWSMMKTTLGDFETVDPVPPPPKPAVAVSAIDLLSSESRSTTTQPKSSPRV